MTTHPFVNSDPAKFDSNCSVCDGKQRDCVHDVPMLLRTVKVLYDNGDSVVTSINGTRSEIRAYYIGQTFNIGAGEEDLLAVGVDVKFYDEQGIEQ